jgi:hypothetical protein
LDMIAIPNDDRWYELIHRKFDLGLIKMYTNLIYTDGNKMKK